jgi:hypothetical protein
MSSPSWRLITADTRADLSQKRATPGRLSDPWPARSFLDDSPTSQANAHGRFSAGATDSAPAGALEDPA